MASRKSSEPKTVYPKSRKEWRMWLSKHHDTSATVKVVLQKKDSPRPGVTYNEAVEEALCFGWIDGKAMKRNESSYFHLFSKRKPKSVWSSINKSKVKLLAKKGAMTEAGYEAIKIAKRDGGWTALDTVNKMEVPADLERELRKSAEALKHWEKFAPYARKVILYWINSARTEETRKKRIAHTVKLAIINKRAMIDKI